ncbi:MAG: hypothetical protein SGJ05_11635 [bacterium]|nr:hypothetical protein [bacterium]
MNTNSNLIPREELELLLSEYATGMLDKGLEVRVETSLLEYPDLHKEAESLRNTLALVDRDAYKASIDYQVRNLSVHVVNAMSRPKRNPLRHLAWLAPTVATAVLIVVMNINPQTQGPDQLTQSTTGTQEVSVGSPSLADSQPATAEQTTLTSLDTAGNRHVNSKVPHTNNKRLVAQEEAIVDDLVVDQIVYKMAIDASEDANETVTGITDSEIDVLLAAVISNETL